MTYSAILIQFFFGKLKNISEYVMSSKYCWKNVSQLKLHQFISYYQKNQTCGADDETAKLMSAFSAHL